MRSQAPRPARGAPILAPEFTVAVLYFTCLIFAHGVGGGRLYACFIGSVRPAMRDHASGVLRLLLRPPEAFSPVRRVGRPTVA